MKPNSQPVILYHPSYFTEFSMLRHKV